MPKLKILKCDILSNFQTMCTCLNLQDLAKTINKTCLDTLCQSTCIFRTQTSQITLLTFLDNNAVVQIYYCVCFSFLCQVFLFLGLPNLWKCFNSNPFRIILGVFSPLKRILEMQFESGSIYWIFGLMKWRPK